MTDLIKTFNFMLNYLFIVAAQPDSATHKPVPNQITTPPPHVRN